MAPCSCCEAVLPEIVDLRSTPDLLAERKEMLTLLAKMVELLPETRRRVLELRACQIPCSEEINMDKQWKGCMVLAVALILGPARPRRKKSRSAASS